MPPFPPAVSFQELAYQRICCQNENSFAVLIWDVHNYKIAAVTGLAKRHPGTIFRRPIIAPTQEYLLYLVFGYAVPANVRQPGFLAKIIPDVHAFASTNNALVPCYQHT